MFKSIGLILTFVVITCCSQSYSYDDSSYTQTGGRCSCAIECAKKRSMGRNVLQGYSTTCRYCLIGACDQSNHADFAKCVEDARLTCSGCPQLTLNERMQRQACRSCLRRCSPAQDDSETTPTDYQFLDLPFQRYSCRQKCQSSSRCPNREYIFGETTRSYYECRQCVTEKCRSYRYYERTEKAICMHNARDGCSSCPTPSQKYRLRMRRCKTCVENKCSSEKSSFSSGGSSGSSSGSTGSNYNYEESPSQSSTNNGELPIATYQGSYTSFLRTPGRSPPNQYPVKPPQPTLYTYGASSNNHQPYRTSGSSYNYGSPSYNYGSSYPRSSYSSRSSYNYGSNN